MHAAPQPHSPAAPQGSIAPTTPVAPLSDAARRVLGYLLDTRADAPQRAVTDRVISRATRLTERAVIDAAGELLDAGHLVCASCTSPPGRFVIPAAGNSAPPDLRPAYEYLRSLRQRALAILGRYRAVRHALNLHESSRSLDTRGQLHLPLPAGEGWAEGDPAAWSRR